MFKNPDPLFQRDPGFVLPRGRLWVRFFRVHSFLSVSLPVRRAVLRQPADMARFRELPRLKQIFRNFGLRLPCPLLNLSAGSIMSGTDNLSGMTAGVLFAIKMI